MTNREFFEYSGLHKEKILDPYYFGKQYLVIPKTKSDTSSGGYSLVKGNDELLDLVDVFAFYKKQGKRHNHPDMLKLVSDVINVLDNTANINLSPFSLFFMVYDSSYAAFKAYGLHDKQKFIYKMLQYYYKFRHKIYQSHGYTSSMLQAVADSYSHKRKSKASIKKIRKVLDDCGFVHVPSCTEVRPYYFLPDDGDSQVFDTFARQHDVVKRTIKNKQEKLPDMVFFKDGEYYVVEMKHTNGSGGGQDKQLNEVIDFIRHKDAHIHFVSYLDGEYSNLLHDTSLHTNKKSGKRTKIGKQYDSIIRLLQKNHGNYFLNTEGFKKFIQQIVQQ